MDLFYRPWMLAWLPLLAAGAALLKASSDRLRERWLRLLGERRTIDRLYPSQALRRRALKYWLEAGALGLVLVALAGPQWGVELVTNTSLGTQVVLAVDTSLSMLTEDVEPNRIGKATRELKQLVDGLAGNRVGVVAFAGQAHTVCPLTTDSDAVKSFLDRVQVGMLPQAGTDIGAAINQGMAMLGRYSGHKAMVILSDGEDLEGQSAPAAREAAEAGIHLFLIGVGTPEGAPIPLRDSSGKVVEYKKDPQGQTVITKLGEQSLIQLAAASKGAYYRTTPDESEAGKVVRHIAELERSRIQAGSRSRYKNRFRLPLLFAILVMLLELLLSERGEIRNSGGANFAGLALLCLLAAGCGKGKAAADVWRGNRDYSAGRFSDALRQYADAARARPNDPAPKFNAGDALYRLDQPQQAAELFAQVAQAPAGAPQTAAKGYYNLGNSEYKQERMKEAAEAYRNCLIKDPSDEDCRHNLALLIQEMKNPQQKKQQKNQDQKDDKDKQQDKSGKNPAKSRPQGMSQEDAQRVLQAVKEREKAPAQLRPSEKPQEQKPGGKDW